MGTNGVNGAKPPVTEALLLQKLQEAKVSEDQAKINEAKDLLEATTKHWGCSGPPLKEEKGEPYKKCPAG